ncbi:hypothetical protein GXW74_16140 [Roseomonas eburnea]|uniref:Uncharacterized protein n=1 Tax=Neoroseomonas eburnea TaxID=1346889 RepID=A0A9X9XE90_9PROT|nr:hypothetical protein [Neoroseomonas eburnea]MBR0682026.1 hypothetical protein [Neoroseomonas eburnea]
MNASLDAWLNGLGPQPGAAPVPLAAVAVGVGRLGGVAQTAGVPANRALR